MGLRKNPAFAREPHCYLTHNYPTPLAATKAAIKLSLYGQLSLTLEHLFLITTDWIMDRYLTQEPSIHICGSGPDGPKKKEKLCGLIFV